MIAEQGHAHINAAGVDIQKPLGCWDMLTEVIEESDRVEALTFEAGPHPNQSFSWSGSGMQPKDQQRLRSLKPRSAKINC